MNQVEVRMGRTIKCPNCGATLEITPDAIAYVCKYCGWVGSDENIEGKGFLMVEPISPDSARESWGEYLKKNLRHAYSGTQVLEFRGVTIPIWIAKIQAYTKYNGYRQERRAVTIPGMVRGPGGMTTQARTKTYPVYIPVRGEFDEVLTYPILGRKHASFFGLEEIRKRVGGREAKPLDVKALLGQKFECLDVEVEEDEAKAISESLAEDEHRSRAEAMTTRLFDCYTDDQVISTNLVFCPVFHAKYLYGGKSYRATLDGTTGDVVKAELPMTLGLRLGYTLLGYVGIALSSISPLFFQGSDSPEITVVPMLAGIALTVFSFLKATAEQRIKRG